VHFSAKVKLRSGRRTPYPCIAQLAAFCQLAAMYALQFA